MMRAELFRLFLIAAMMGLAAASCGDDDDDATTSDDDDTASGDDDEASTDDAAAEGDDDDASNDDDATGDDDDASNDDDATGDDDDDDATSDDDDDDATTGDDDDDDNATTGDDDDDTGDPTSATIGAEGGELLIEGAKLIVPAGALAEETTLTIEEVASAGLPQVERLLSAPFELGPDGTEFAKTVELQLGYDGSKLTGGARATVARLENETWTTLATIAADGTAAAALDHFSIYAVVATEFETQASSAECRAFAGFDGCGGDLTGTWEVTLGCAIVEIEAGTGGDGGDDDDDDDGAAENPFAETCPTAIVEGAVLFTGEATFEEDGTYSVTRETQVRQRATVPKGCFPFDEGVETCAALAEATIKGATVTRDDASECVFEVVEEELGEETVSGNFASSGDTLVLSGEDGAAVDDMARYCIEGDTITVKLVQNDDGQFQTVVYQGTRSR